MLFKLYAQQNIFFVMLKQTYKASHKKVEFLSKCGVM